jgi:hypothetical protein
VIKYIEIYFYDERLHCHDVTKLNDVALWCAVLFIGLSLLATVCFQQQCRNLKVIGKFIVTSPILNRFSTFLRHVVQNRKICNICAGRQRVTAQNFEIGCFVYGINAKVNIARDVAFQKFHGLLQNFS